MRKRFITGILAAVMVVSSLQIQNVSVLAMEQQQTEENGSIMEKDVEIGTAAQEEESGEEETKSETGAQEESAAEEKKTESGMQEEDAEDTESGTQEEDAKDTESEAEMQEEEADAGEEETAEDAEEVGQETEGKAGRAYVASGTYKENGSDVSWAIDENGKLTVEGTGEFAASGRTRQNPKTPWYSYRASILSVEIKVTDMTDASFMFYECRNLTSVDLGGFDTSKVTDMGWMFDDCRSLTSLDVSGFDTSKVTNMQRMFLFCTSLTDLDLRSFRTGNVTDMSWMFYCCYNLTSLDVSSFNTANVTDMSCMFYGCNSLTSLDVSSFDTGKVTNMNCMFTDCSGLTSLDVRNFKTRNVTNMGSMFSSCKSLTNLDMSSFDTSSVTDMRSMFGACWSLTSLDLSNFDTSNVTNMSSMFLGCNRLTDLNVESFDTGKVTNMSSMFSACTDLMSLDLSGFHTGNVTDMRGMFNGCKSLTSLDLSNFDTGNVTTMQQMFWACSSLTSLNMSGFDTSKVTHMGDMFDECGSLISLDLSSFDTSNVTNMYAMFYNCRSLTSLDLSSFDTGKVHLMEYMFWNCRSLTGLNVSSFNTSQVINMDEMFFGCSNLSSLDVSGFDTSKVMGMSSMFSGCSSLTSLDVSGFDTSGVGDDTDELVSGHMYGMFSGCSGLTSLDLSSFDVGKVDNLNNIFSGCKSLEIIYTPRNVQVEALLPHDEDSDIWYDYEGNSFTELPQNLSYSIVLMKNNQTPVATISATKTKTLYGTGETLNVDDVRVCYCDESGVVVKVTEGFTTNAAEIDMSTPGKKILEITYNNMTTEVEIEVVAAYTVTFTGTGKDDIVKGTADRAKKDADYIFRLVRESGYIYTVTATMGEEPIIPTVNRSGNTYTIPNVTADLIITIEKTADQSPEPKPEEPEDTTGLQIKFVNENDRQSIYTGKAIQPVIKVTYNGKRLRAGVDYTIKYSNNIKVGTAKITITGKGNFSKANSQTTFDIVAKNIGDKDVILCGATADGKESLTFANAAKLTPVLYYNNIKLTGKDYVIKAENGSEIANKKLSADDNGVTVKIEGKTGGNFTGSREVTLKVVNKKELMKFTVAVDKTKVSALTYNGSEQYIHDISGALTVTAKNPAKTQMQYGTDYTIVYPNDVTSAGTKKFTVVGMGIYTGSVSKSYTVKPAKEAALKVFYDGTEVTGNKISDIFNFASTGITFNSRLSVKGSGDGLIEGKDYKVSYSGNKKVNQNAKCIISFLGNYKGHAKLTVSFEIAKADLSKTDVIIADQLYKSKAGIYKSVPYVIEDKDRTNSLLSSSNYKVTYYIQDPTNNADALQMKGKNKAGDGDTVWVKLEAKGKNYSGEKIVNYKIRQAQDLSKAKITFQDAEGRNVKSTAYTGSKITASQIKAVVNGTLAENDTDIEVIYVNNINKGKATVIVKAAGGDGCKYTGCKKTTFSIVARNLN